MNGQLTEQDAFFYQIVSIHFKRDYHMTIRTLFNYSAAASFSLLMVCESPAARAQENTSFYEDGALFMETSAWEKAFVVWYKGRSALDKAGVTDPKLGIAFIEFATKKNVLKYYGTASEMYIWGFSKCNFDLHERTIKMEVARLLPLVPKDEKKDWQAILKSRDSQKLYNKIKAFWLEKDPTPTTMGNERLIEHWQRINYARKHFTMNVRVPYASDPRGEIWVKYGKPSRSRSGTLGSRTTEYGRLIDDSSARELVRQYDANPNYDVWVYDNIGGRGAAVFLFGNAGGNGPFSLVPGVEALIDPKAIGSIAARQTGLDAGFYIQMAYYDELRVMDAFFDARYSELDREWSNGQSPTNTKKLRNTFKMYAEVDRLNPNYKHALPEKTSYDEKFSKITITAQQARFLDESNEPRLAVLAFSTPRMRGGEIQIINKQMVKIPKFTVLHTLIVRDENYAELDREQARWIRGLENTAVFIVKDFEKSYRYFLAAEAVALNNLDSTALDSKNAFASGKLVLKRRPPLASIPDSLQLSDLIIGVDFPVGIDASPLYFPILPARRVFSSDQLKAYIEIYHLIKPDAKNGSYKIEFTISKTKRDFLETIKTAMISSEFNYEAASPTAKETLGIDISQLKSGKYEILVRVTDLSSGQIKERSANFIIIHNQQKQLPGN